MQDSISFQKIKVKIDTNWSEYNLYLSNNKSPFYLNADNKDSEDIFWADALILPISYKDFYKNTADYFYGIRIIVKIELSYESYLDEDMMRALTQVEIAHDVRRIRFYAEKESIMIDKIYSTLYPTQIVKLAGKDDICNFCGQQFTLNLLYKLADFYGSRRV